LVTNCPVETPSLWEQASLSVLIDEAVFSTVEQLRKPDPEIFQRCVRRLRLSPRQCVYVGDGANDEMQGAHSAGLTPVLLVTGHVKGNNWDGCTVSKLTELLEVLDCMEPLEAEPTD
jgi:putative hydrolase of the HAD superfamily